jgi:TonB-linked SusC/RagA family outer membrane protein
MSAERWGLGENLSTTNTGSVFSDFEHAYIDNANVPATSSISGSPWGKGGILSYFGRVNYDYKETYMLTLVLRADASSNFAKGHRWGTFPSVSAGWLVSNEQFMESAKSFLNFLKIRGSWGQNGNQSIPGFQYVSQIAYNTDATRANYYFNSDKETPTLGAYPLNIPTFDLKWETSEQLDLGFDTRFLNSKMNISFDYYKKTTKDWLVAAPILASWGVDNAPYINGGEIVNKGIEIALGWNDNVGDFTYGISGNMSYNHNEVTDIKNSQKLINANNVKLWGNGPYVARAQVGFPVGYFWGYKTVGIFQNEAEVANYKNSEGKVIMPNALPGDVKFVDTNGDGVIDDNDKVMIGDPNPNFIYSLNLKAGYKGFDLLVTFYGVAGNQIARCWHDAGQGDNNYTTEILNRWHGEGTSNKIPRVTAGSSINFQYTSDLQIENGDYLRVSNLTLGYDIKKLVKAIPLQQLRLFFTVQNLFTFTKYSGMDPEIGTSTDDTNYGWGKGVDLGFYPSPRTVMIGASVKF